MGELAQGKFQNNNRSKTRPNKGTSFGYRFGGHQSSGCGRGLERLKICLSNKG